jgi:protein-L-isoaspartate(D-aspartate) O-methyltransferase
MNDWQHKACRLASDIAGAGMLDAQWRPPFEQVPRHLFIPCFYRDDDTLVDGSDPGKRADWLAAIYRDESLITQHLKIPGTDVRWPTSSSTQPSLMARMLNLLDVADGHRVMEIGTGTGYNAALISHRLHDHNVASIDIDPTLIELAGQRLDQAGYRPFLTAGDGADGIPARAPFDRIIATCAVETIPSTWINQLNDQGVIVADFRGELSSALVKLTKTGPDTVQGRFLAVPGHFMWMRPDLGNPLRDAEGFTAAIDTDGTRESSTTLSPTVLRDPEFRFMLTLTVPGVSFVGSLERDLTRVHILRTSDRSWVEIDATGQRGRYATRQGGRRAVWDEVEATATRWANLGHPDRSRFGLTASPTGIHHVWLDNPDNIFSRILSRAAIVEELTTP